MQLPANYQLKAGIKYDKDLKRYLWRPQRGDLFYTPKLKKIFQYIKWDFKPGNVDAYLVSLDGYGQIKELGKKNGIWTNNIQVRQCIPIEKI